MATTTPNFGWSVPTSSDLVKNGATAIETLGDSIDASMVDLKGGTTGQVLAKATNTDMDFTWTTASGGSSNMAGKNGCLNSNYSIWQRGTSVVGAGGGVYTADRWFLYAGSQITVTRQATGDTTNLPFIQYCARVQRNLASADATAFSYSQSFETLNSLAFAGKAVTVSFYARKGANYSPTSSLLEARVITGTGTDQNAATGYTGSANAISQSATLTTTWQRFSYSATLSSSLTELAVAFVMTPTGVAGAADYFEVTGVQLEIAASASAYSPNAATQAAEIAACQRYYYRNTAPTATAIGYAIGRTSTQADIVLTFPVTMRTNPTAVETGGSFDFTNPNVGAWTITSFTFVHCSYQTGFIKGNTASGLSQGITYELGIPTSGYVGFSAEL
jgi:hypothetical protein